MAFRYDDAERTLSCSVRDVVEQGFGSGHLTLEVVRSRRRRMAEGREIHEARQAAQALADEAYQAEQVVRHQLIVGDWTVQLHGRVDGLTREGDTTLVEEIKSVSLDHDRLYTTTIDDWPHHVAQLEVYLWMLARAGHDRPMGRLVLVSVVDGSQHVIGLSADVEAVEARVRRWLAHAIAAREDRLAWLDRRRPVAIPWPFDDARPGQAELRRQAEASLTAGRTALLQAPTGLGKTAAVLVAALRHAFATDKQVFWATARTTQQSVAVDTAARLVAAGLPLRVVVITAKEKACLNDAVTCRPDACPFAHLHHDKVAEHRVLQRAWAAGLARREVVRDLGATFEVCPYQVASDVARNADLVIGDYNYAFDPELGSQTLYGEDLARWVVVVDEAHQLVERARGYGSPGVESRLARQALAGFTGTPGYGRFQDLAERVLETVDEVVGRTGGPWRRDEAEAALRVAPWQRLAEAIDEVGADYAVLAADRPAFDGEDPWLALARQVLAFHGGIERAGEETVTLVSRRRGREGVRLLCLDPSGLTGPRFARLGGALLCSATLSPSAFYRDLLGLDPERLDTLAVPSPFPPENRRVVLAPRVSTRFKDRESHAPRTAELLARVVAATPGNVAVYFPSFAMLDDLVERMELGDRELLRQQPGLDDSTRAAWLDTLRTTTTPTVLAACLGGVFAEGIDLPGGALRTVVVVGPALPPVGLERDLLRGFYDARYGSGFAYASLIPGMTKVVQAAGRLVRGPEDSGCIVLVGQRFRWRDHAALLPDEWDPEVPDDPAERVADFFSPAPPPPR